MAIATNKVRELLKELQQYGYSLYINNGTLAYSYRGENQPDPEIVMPLLQQAKGHTQDIKAYLEDRSQDPRQDLTEDSQLWQAVLKVAIGKDYSVYGVLHGIRCAGGKLALTDGELRLLPRYGNSEVTSITGPGHWQDIRKEWLLPHKEQISRIFDTVKETLNERQAV